MQMALLSNLFPLRRRVPHSYSSLLQHLDQMIRSFGVKPLYHRPFNNPHNLYHPQYLALRLESHASAVLLQRNLSKPDNIT